MKKTILVIVVLFSILAISLPVLYGQGGIITGVVVDGQGEPIPGATVVEKGHPGNAATTDIDGTFSMHVSATTYTLKVSCLGYKNFEGTFTTMYPHIVLEEDD